MSLSIFRRKPRVWYGSKAWANWILKNGIKELKNKGRPESARLLEVIYYLKALTAEGFDWQAERLRNHWHLAIKNGFLSFEGCLQAEGLTPLEKGGGDSS